MLTFVDANVFIRLFVEDDSGQAEQSVRLFERARAGEIELVTGPPVFFEIAWVLGYRYKIDGGKILDILEAILAFPNLKTLDKELVMASILLARKIKNEFADSYIAASAASAGADNIATFNKRHFAELATPLYPL